MTIARRGLKIEVIGHKTKRHNGVKVKVVGQGNAVGPTSINGSFFSHIKDSSLLTPC